jgi:hypothetical protein
MSCITNGLLRVLFCLTALFSANTDLSAKQCPWPKKKCAPRVIKMIKKNSTYRFLYHELCPQVDTIRHLLDTVTNCATYDLLWEFCNGFAGSIPNGRLVVTLPDGTVVVDTFQDYCDCATPDCTNLCPNAATANGCNGYNFFLAKFVNENQNTRVANMDAQMFPCGVGCETRFSTTVGAVQAFVAIRLGPYLHNSGTARLSQTVTPGG